MHTLRYQSPNDKVENESKQRRNDTRGDFPEDVLRYDLLLGSQFDLGIRTTDLEY